MSDDAFNLLAQAINQTDAPSLWVVDENIGAEQLQQVMPRSSLQLVTNRCDLHALLQQRGFQVQLNDFQLAAAGAGIACIFYRVSKEKPVVHWLINQSAECLAVGGQLFLAGYKNEGIKTYVTKAADFLGTLAAKRKGAKTALLAEIVADGHAAAPLDDQHYTQLRIINNGEPLPMYSKPGVYGWNKQDKGSALLIECLRNYRPSLPAALLSVLDLGCGYGYLSLQASRLIDAEFTACDNNITATECCQHNFLQHGIKGQVVNDDCGASLASSQFALVLCNPPFHQGFTVESDLTAHFLQAVKRLLETGGVALFVVNGFIPLERKAQGLFTRCELLAERDGFKVLALKH
jgi:16S rRNA (guanine1207-N2)-methyltransferase